MRYCPIRPKGKRMNTFPADQPSPAVLLPSEKRPSPKSAFQHLTAIRPHPSGSPYRFKAISVPTIPMIHRKIAAILFCSLLTPLASFLSGSRQLPQRPGPVMDLKSFDYFHEPVYDGKAQMIKNKTTRGILLLWNTFTI